MIRKVKMPEIVSGEDEITFVGYDKNRGETISEGDDLCEVVTDKAAFNVPSPFKGVVTNVFKKEGDKVASGDIIAEIEEE